MRACKLGSGTKAVLVLCIINVYVILYMDYDIEKDKYWLLLLCKLLLNS